MVLNIGLGEATKERARNTLIFISPHPDPLPEGEGVRRSSYFMHVPNPFFPPNRACGSPAHGSPVENFLIGIDMSDYELKWTPYQLAFANTIAYATLKSRFENIQFLFAHGTFQAQP
jgi:hypothetical protein